MELYSCPLFKTGVYMSVDDNDHLHDPPILQNNTKVTYKIIVNDGQALDFFAGFRHIVNFLPTHLYVLHVKSLQLCFFRKIPDENTDSLG